LQGLLEVGECVKMYVTMCKRTSHVSLPTARRQSKVAMEMNPNGPASVTLERRYFSTAGSGALSANNDDELTASSSQASSSQFHETEVEPGMRAKGIYLGKQLFPLTETELNDCKLAEEEVGTCAFLARV